MMKKLTGLAAATALILGNVAPALAAQPLSLASSPTVRASAQAGPASDLRGRSDTTIQIAVIALIALLIWGGTELFSDDDDPDNPVSP